MEINIRKILGDFGKENRIFQSEAQFQFELAWKIQKQYPSYKVSLEVASASEMVKNKLKRYYSDIIVSDKNGNYIVIELKYKTKTANYPELGITLLNHSATDLGRFDFLWDVHRIELLKVHNEDLYKFNNNLKTFIHGYAILLTNEHKYWSISKENNNALYKNFCISKRDFIKKDTPLTWNKVKDKSCVDETKRDVTLVFDKDYKFVWQDYNTDFKFLLLEI